MIKNLLKGKPSVITNCDICETEIETMYVPGQTLKWFENPGAFENFTCNPCPNCGSAEVLVVNIPDEQLTERFLEATGMKEENKNQYRFIRYLKSQMKFE